MAMHPGTDMERVRHVLARELETISEYEQLSREAQDPRVRDFLAHLAAEEKEHVTEAVLVLRQLDPTQDEHFNRGVADDHFTSGAPGVSRSTSGPANASHGAVPVPRVSAPRLPAPLTVAVPPPDGTPVSPSNAVHAVPAPPSDVAIPFTVGSLRSAR